MDNYKKILGTILVSIIIVVIALFLVCAGQRRGGGPGFDDGLGGASDDKEYRDQLLDMLDLGDQSSGSSESVTAEPSTSSEDADVFSLLGGEESTTRTTSTSGGKTNTESGLTEELYLNAQSEVGRLEKLLNTRISAADSLRRVINERTSRIAELEKKIENYRSGADMAQTTSATRYSRSEYASTSNYQPGSSDAKGRYEMARGRFENRDYNSSIAEFERLLSENQNWSLADNCQYWMGECYYGLKDYSRAIAEFEKVFSYQADDKFDDATIMIGLCYYRMGQNDQARAEFEELLNRYPASEYTHVAEKYLARI